MGRQLNAEQMDEVIETLEPNLPPPGASRTDELKRRADKLAQDAEELAVDSGVEAIDPAKLRIDNEIAQHMNEYENWNLTVSKAREDMVYKWVYRDPQGKFGGYFVTRERLPQNGPWEIVQGTSADAPEGREYLHVDGTRVVGDTVLMRLRKDLYIMLCRREHNKSKRLSESVTSRLEELGDRAHGKGIKVHTDVDNMNPQMAKKLFDSAHARQLVNNVIDQRLRDGTMPGVPAPGTRR